jgi:hypothetical protein
MEVVFVGSRGSGQKVIGELTANYGGDLREPATLRNAIKSLHQCILQRLGDFGRSKDGSLV